MLMTSFDDFKGKDIKIYLLEENVLYGKLTNIDKGGIIITDDDDHTYFIPKRSILYIEA